MMSATFFGHPFNLSFSLANILIKVYNDDPIELLEEQDWSDVSSNQLREVEMKNIYGTRCELEFIKLLLAKSPMLETVIIEPNLDKDVDKGLRILKELTRFWRLSPQAEITYGSL
ncbi:F-box/FBD/LRR-repeat protein [Camellia lanceoleosa]|uniref:F-box/FBD/LRR-repeat protein n=1 Tax=Camellia lanceoleosa TaxID=1840588 RepID=A0ACC0IHL1_9ERIC|nr:F-box/FBD/LRR-repeat protein [Camellia lanceoleosa]